MNKVAVITGGSSGIGKATAIELKKRGLTVYELSRRDSDIPGIIHIKADVTDGKSVSDAIDRVISEQGRIDILINNAGYGISGAVEFTQTEDAMRLFDVNFFGMVRMTEKVIPYMRENGGGRIVNISSVAAVVPIPFQTYYSASKAAISSYSMALANEVGRFGIRVSAIMPGDISTGFTDARKKITEGDDVYLGSVSRSVGTMEKDERGGMDVTKAGAFVAKAAIDRRHKPLYTIGAQYKLAVLLTKILPAAWLNRLIRIIYAK